MKLKLILHLWGVDQTCGLIRHLPRWQEVGYEGVEVSLRKVTDQAAFRQFLRDSGLSWIPQIFSRDFLPGGSVSEHVDSLREQMEECLDVAPLFFNAHSGYDNWCSAEAEDFFGQMLA